MTDISIANGFILNQQTKQTQNPSTGSKPSAGFMESLKQTGAAVTDAGASADKKAVNPANGTGANKAENTASKPDRDTSGGAEKSEDVSDAISAGGNVKVDEATVKELEQLKGIKQPEAEKAAEETDGKALKQDSDTLQKEDKSLLEQAEEALANAMLKAFKELNDPEKNREEFEEKLLLFLLKFVDSINGKTDKDSSFGSDNEEDEENLGGALMQIVENMLENAEKNAEISGQAAQSEAAFVGNYFLNVNETAAAENSDNPAGFAVKAAENKLYPEQLSLDRREEAGTDPVIPPVHTQSVGNKAAGAVTDINIGVDTDSEAAVQVNAFEPQFAGSSIVGEAETALGGALVSEPIVAALNGSSRSAQNVTIEAKQPELSYVSEQVMPIGENQSESASLFNGAYGNHSANDTVLSFAKTNDVSETFELSGASNEIVVENPVVSANDQIFTKTYSSAKEAVLSPVLTKAEGNEAPEASVKFTESSLPEGLETEVQLTDIPFDKAESELYGQIAVNVYNDAKRTLKTMKEEKTEPTIVNGVSQSAEKTEETSESEFDELARLFGLKRKERELPPQEEEESEQSAGFANNRRSESEEKDISFSDVKFVSTKAVEAPIPRSLPTGGAVNRVITQVVNQILANIPEKGQETTLMVTLNPETLGKISIKLVENAGKLSVTISAENRETASILASRVESVQESMRDQGTQLEKYQVVYSAEQDGRAEQQNYEGSSKNPYVRNIEDDGDDDGEFEEILRGAV